MQGKIFIQWGRFSFFFRSKLPNHFIQKLKTAVGLEQQGSQAAGSRFGSISYQLLLRIIPYIFRYPKSIKD